MSQKMTKYNTTHNKYMYDKESSLIMGDFVGFPHLHVLINVPKNGL